MAERLQIFECKICGHVIEVLRAGGGTLVCCDQPMQLHQEKTADASTEKHVPVIEKEGKGFRVKVGSVPHPMEAEHFIEWIEIQFDDKVGRKFLKPGEKAEAFFDGVPSESIQSREFCNKHGLWKA